MKNEERDYLLAEVASMYYEEKKSQAEIARSINCSRSLVSMMLTEAMETGIIHIRINYPLARETKLERSIKDRFGLQDALVVKRGNLSYSRMLRLLGRLGANYISHRLPSTGILGIGWGVAVAEVVSALNPQSAPEMKVVQLTGAFSGLSNPLIDGPELARALAINFGAFYYTLNAPAIVKNESIRKALLEEKPIRDVLGLGSMVDVAVIGIGATHPDVSSMLRVGYMSMEELSMLQKVGVVGDICGYHYDINGEVLDLDINRRVIGINLDVLKDPKCLVIGIAGGEQKAKAILGALRGKFVNVLVTDNVAAEWIQSL